jgi:hypothetical protein
MFHGVGSSVADQFWTCLLVLVKWNFCRSPVEISTIEIASCHKNKRMKDVLYIYLAIPVMQSVSRNVIQNFILEGSKWLNNFTQFNKLIVLLIEMFARPSTSICTNIVIKHFCNVVPDTSDWVWTYIPPLKMTFTLIYWFINYLPNPNICSASTSSFLLCLGQKDN